MDAGTVGPPDSCAGAWVAGGAAEVRMTDDQRLRHLEWYMGAVEALIANDALAMTYQTLGQYRRGMLKNMKAMQEQRGLREAA